jgi:hypothetical protein
MSGRILMATVAALALAAPAGAQDQAKPLDTEQDANQQLEQAQPTPQAESAPAGAGGEAEQAPAMAADQPTAEPMDEEVAAEEEPAPPADMEFIEAQDETQFLANDEVIGKDVVNIMNEEVGEIADLVMDQDQRLVGVVLSVGGFLGLGEKWVAVPVDTIQFPSAEQPARLLLGVTKEQLENAPDFTTRAAVEAEAAGLEAQRQAMQQQQQIPSPATTSQ